MLEKLSIRLEKWVCRNLVSEERFYRKMRLLINLQRLKLFHFSRFENNSMKYPPLYQFGESVMNILGEKSRIY